MKRKRTETRRNRRTREKEEAIFSGYEARPDINKKFLENPTTVQTRISMQGCKAASSGYIGIKGNIPSSQVHELRDLVGETSKFHFKLQEWDGQLSISSCSLNLFLTNFLRTSMAILDLEGRLVAILAGCPADKSWQEVIRQATKALENARRGCRMKEEEGEHRRGKFFTLRCGVSYGGGQRTPMNIDAKSARNKKILADLNGSQAFQRISGFTNSKSSASHFCS